MCKGEITALEIMSSSVTADIVEGQIDTASGLLRWIEAEADKTRRAISVSPLLIALTYILGSIIKKFESKGTYNFDQLHAGYASSKLLEVHQAIRMMISHSRQAGLYVRIPCNRLFAKVEGQGKELEKIATALYLVDENWQSVISEAASAKIALAQKEALNRSDQTIELFDSTEDPSHYPSEDAIRRQLNRAATLDTH
ncbi:MAG: hypothetical protein P0120_07745 [Nitrospira sp.]|nr:hypothetical protein [Nitrospira sp.]